MLDGHNVGATAAAKSVAEGSLPEMNRSANVQQGPSSESSDKAVSDALLEALAAFVKRSKGIPEPEPKEKISVMQYLGLSILICNTIVAYLTISSLLPNLIEAPVWRLVVQIASLTVGSSYLVSRSATLQKRLLAKAANRRFLGFMMVLFIFFGAVGFTQLPEFAVPVTNDREMTSFCAEIVDDFNEVKEAAAPDSSLPQRQSCAGGNFQLRGDRSIRSLKLFKSYMITAVYASRNERYYLGRGVVFKVAFGLASEALHLGTVTPEIHVPSPAGRTIKIAITREIPGQLVYVPPH